MNGPSQEEDLRFREFVLKVPETETIRGAAGAFGALLRRKYEQFMFDTIKNFKEQHGMEEWMWESSEIKMAINNLIWMHMPPDMTLREAEALATKMHADMWEAACNNFSDGGRRIQGKGPASEFVDGTDGSGRFA